MKRDGKTDETERQTEEQHRDKKGQRLREINTEAETD